MRVTSPVADELVAISTSLARSASLRVAGESDADGGGGHENHDGAVSEMTMGDAVMDLGPNSTVELAPGGLHVMLEGLERPLVEGESFELVLMFREAGEREVNVFVSTNEPID
jgi:copper(I)-binding protein